LCMYISTFVSTLSFLFCPLFVGSFFGCERVSCSVAFYSLCNNPTQDNGSNGINLNSHRISLVQTIHRSQRSHSHFHLSNSKVFTFIVCFLSWIQILQLGWHKKAILASGFCLFMLIELCLNGKLIFCWRVVYFIRIWF